MRNFEPEWNLWREEQRQLEYDRMRARERARESELLLRDTQKQLDLAEHQFSNPPRTASSIKTPFRESSRSPRSNWGGRGGTRPSGRGTHPRPRGMIPQFESTRYSQTVNPGAPPPYSAEPSPVPGGNGNVLSDDDLDTSTSTPEVNRTAFRHIGEPSLASEVESATESNVDRRLPLFTGRQPNVNRASINPIPPARNNREGVPSNALPAPVAPVVPLPPVANGNPVPPARNSRVAVPSNIQPVPIIPLSPSVINNRHEGVWVNHPQSIPVQGERDPPPPPVRNIPSSRGAEILPPPSQNIPAGGINANDLNLFVDRIIDAINAKRAQNVLPVVNPILHGQGVIPPPHPARNNANFPVIPANAGIVSSGIALNQGEGNHLSPPSSIPSANNPHRHTHRSRSVAFEDEQIEMNSPSAIFP